MALKLIVYNIKTSLSRLLIGPQLIRQLETWIPLSILSVFLDGSLTHEK